MFEKFFKGLKDEYNKQKEINKNFTDNLYCTVERGRNHIFTKNFKISKTSEGKVFINNIHEVKIINCSEYRETVIGKSASKKVAGALVGGALTGGAGAIVGALAVGNNKKKISKHNLLVAVDKNGYTHQVILKSTLGQRNLINRAYI